VWSPIPLERSTARSKRRAHVVEIFPDEAAIVRLVGAVLMETQDEWQISERRYCGGVDGRGLRGRGYAPDHRGKAGLARLLDNADYQHRSLRITGPDLSPMYTWVRFTTPHTP